MIQFRARVLPHQKAAMEDVTVSAYIKDYPPAYPFVVGRLDWGGERESRRILSTHAYEQRLPVTGIFQVFTYIPSQPLHARSGTFVDMYDTSVSFKVPFDFRGTNRKRSTAQRGGTSRVYPMLTSRGGSRAIWSC